MKALFITAIAFLMPFILLLVSAPAMAKDLNGFLQDSEFLAKAKEAITVSDEVSARCARYGIENYQMSGLYRLIAKYENGNLESLETSDQIKYPYLDYLENQTKLPRPQANQMAPSRDQLMQNLEVFGDQKLLSFIAQFGARVKDKIRVPLKITGMTYNSSKTDDDHCGHRSGLAADIRPLPGDVPNSWNDQTGNYNQKMNKQLLELLLSSRSIKRVLFNDPELLNDKDLQKIIAKRSGTGSPVEYSDYTHKYTWNGELKTVHHDNHIHIEVYPENEVQALAEGVWSALNQ